MSPITKIWPGGTSNRPVFSWGSSSDRMMIGWTRPLGRRVADPRLWVGQSSKCEGNGVEGDQNPAFETPKGGKAENHEFPLQWAEVVTSEDEIVSKVERAGGKGRTSHAVAPRPEQAPPADRNGLAKGHDLAQQLSRPRRGFSCLGHGIPVQPTIASAGL